MTRFRFPHPLTLLLGCVLIAAVLSHLLPAGEYQRREDAATGRKVVVPNSYQRAEPAPVSPFQAFVAVPKGMADAADVIFYVFLVGGAFAVVERTGALRRIVDALSGAGRWVIPLSCLAFGAGGALIQMQEELIAFVPALLLLARRMGYNALTAVAMSLGAAAVGAAFSPLNPFQAVIAMKVAELPTDAGRGFRFALLIPAMALWIWSVTRYARRTATAPSAGGDITITEGQAPHQLAVLAVVVVTFAVFLVGVGRYHWDFAQLAALFFIMGIAAGLIGRLGVGGTADGFVEGFRSMAYAGLLIGFARAIYVVLEQGRIVDTVVNGLVAPLADLPLALSAVGMMLVQTLVHFPVPSTSGQAVLTLPVLVPVSDLLGLSRQITVLAYQGGAGLCELLTPTNGALMAMLAAAGVPFEEWLRFIWRPYLLLAAVAVAGIVAGIAAGV